jgi:folate-binding protein YgfZ
MEFRCYPCDGGGEIYLVNQPRLGSTGFDLFVPNEALADTATRLVKEAATVGGRLCGWQAFEMARIERGIPRFGVDMDESNLPLEAGLETRAISYDKGCYIGQEVINRIRTIGHVTRTLCRLRFSGQLTVPPSPGDKLFKEGKEVGTMTSFVALPMDQGNIGLGYVRYEVNAIGTDLVVRTKAGETTATMVGVAA